MDNEFIQHRAERTFDDLLDAWVGYETPMFSYPSNHSFQEINYLRIILPPLSKEVPSLYSNWFIFAYVKEPQLINCVELNCDCFELVFDSKIINNLYEFCRSENNVYLALAVVRNGDGKGITVLPPLERFDWYVICLEQFFSTMSLWRLKNKILIPKHNILNLATFSLIWSAQWVSSFHSAFYNKLVTQNGKLFTEAKKIFQPQFGIDYLQSVKDQKFFLSHSLPNVRNEVDDQIFNQLALRLGLGVALNDINSQMLFKSNIDKIYNYCPEALYGTANLWLFSRAYHNFMQTSSKVTEPFQNMRLLPIYIDKLTYIPPILKSVIWQVLLYYRNIKVNVKIIPTPNKDFEPNRDRSYYGGGIGYFPWLIFSEDYLKQDYHTSTVAEANENLEFLSLFSKQAIVSEGFTTSMANKNLIIIKDHAQLELNPRKPTILFPTEDAYLEHPKYLWMLPL